MHESMFSYSLSRPYPYRWFTWVVFIGGAVAIVLFSLLNFQIAGFELVPVHTTNTTEIESPSKTAWYHRRPWSLTSKISPTCSDQLISVGSSYYTNNRAFSYLVNRISTDSRDQNPSMLSQAYKNAPLQDCKIFSIDLMGTLDSAASANASIHLVCSLPSTEYPTTVFLSTDIECDRSGFSRSDPSSVFAVPYNLNRNASSLFWGSALAESYMGRLHDYAGLRYDLSNVTIDVQMSWTIDNDNKTLSAILTYKNSSDYDDHDTMHIVPGNYSGTADSGNNALSAWSYASLADEAVGSYFLDYPDFLNGIGLSNVSFNDPDFLKKIYLYNVSDPTTPMALYSDQLGKSLYWTVLTDLGQIDNNILAHPQQLMDYFATSTNKSVEWGVGFMNRPILTSSGAPYTEPQAYLLGYRLLSTNKNVTEFYHEVVRTEVPNVQPSVFAFEYTCEVPKMKTTGTLFISILVADLVFLQALWKLLNWLTTLILSRQDHHANYCAGCERVSHRGVGDIEMRHGLHRVVATNGPEIDGSEHSNEPPSPIMSADDNPRWHDGDEFKDSSTVLLRSVSNGSEK